MGKKRATQANNGDQPFGEDNPLLNLTEVGKMCNKTRQTIASWVRDGLIPAVRGPAGTTLIKRSDVYKSFPNLEIKPLDER